MRNWQHTRTTTINGILICFWLLFSYFWTKWGWNSTATLFDYHWWYDTAGHAVFGFAGGLTLLYLFHTYAVVGIFRFAGKKFLGIIIVAIITLIGIFWEAGELLWDLRIQPNYFSWLGVAQINSIDTTVDLLTNTFFSAFSMLTYSCYSRVYEYLYPNEDEKEEIEEIIALIRHASLQIGARRRENLKHIVPALRELIRIARDKRKLQKK